jgi:hypothetical protein
MVPSVFTPVLAVWYLLFLHLFWQYGTFCFYTCSGIMVPSVFTPVLVVWYLLDFTPVLAVWYLLLLRTGVKTEGTILPEQV